jgi:hypothetical protein
MSKTRLVAVDWYRESLDHALDDLEDASIAAKDIFEHDPKKAGEIGQACRALRKQG